MFTVEIIEMRNRGLKNEEEKNQAKHNSKKDQTGCLRHYIFYERRIWSNWLQDI